MWDLSAKENYVLIPTYSKIWKGGKQLKILDYVGESIQIGKMISMSHFFITWATNLR